MDQTMVFSYHLTWGFAVALVVSLFWAKNVATQSTISKTQTGDSITTNHVDHRQFLRTWALFTASGTGTWFILLVVWQLRTFLMDSGYIG